jgi:NADH dehydrogenase
LVISIIPQGFLPSYVELTLGIAEYGDRSITGFPAWLMWGLLHLRTLAGGHSKLSIVANWLRLLVTYRRSARLIVEPGSTAERGDYVGALRN